MNQEKNKNPKRVSRKFLAWFLTGAFLLAIIFVGWFGQKFHPEVLKTEISLGNSEGHPPRGDLRLKFSFPILPKFYTGIKVRRADSVSSYEEINLSVSSERKEIIIRPKNFWQPETEYSIVIPSGKNYLYIPVREKNINFSTEKYPVVTNVSPEDGEKDVVLDIEDPVVIDFDKSTKNYYIDFSLSPESDVIYENNPEKTQFKILPKEKLSEGTAYQLKISIKPKDAPDEEYKKLTEVNFETLPPLPATFEKDYPLRLSQAKRFTRPKIETGKYIDINLASQVMTIFENGEALDSYLVSSGKRGMDTPKGEHKIYNKHPRTWSKQYGLYMPFWMAITSSGKFGLHELPEWPGGYKEGANHLGIPVSHGCVRMGVGAAERVYNFADIGTPVIVY